MAKGLAVAAAGNGEIVCVEHLQLVDEKKAAAILGLAVRTLQDWRRQTHRGRPRGPAYIITGTRAVRYRVVDLKRWVDDNRHPAAQDGAAR